MEFKSVLGPGKQLHELKVQLPDDRSAAIPVITVEGARSGPALLAIAAQHGIELNGTVALMQFLQRLDPARLAGTFTCVPVANPLAFRYRRHYLEQGPEEPYSGEHPHNMNRTWPGNSEGNATERLSAALWPLVEAADYVLDFHCFEAIGASAVLTRSDTLEFAKAFGLPRLDVSPATPAPAPGREGRQLQAQATVIGKPALTIELRGQYHIWPSSVAEGVKGLFNVLAWLESYPAQPELPDRYYLSTECESVFIEAEEEGVFLPALEPGREVAAGEELGVLWAPWSGRRWSVTAPVAGFLRAIGPLRPDGDVALRDQHWGVQQGTRLAQLWLKR